MGILPGWDKMYRVKLQIMCFKNLLQDIIAVNKINYSDMYLPSFCFFMYVNRTARGDKQGTALSFVSVNENKLFQEVEQAQMVNTGKHCTLEM